MKVTKPKTLHHHPITVLLVDDQEIVAEAVERILQDLPNIKFHYCQDPSKALEMAREVSPTVILSDLVMPEVDGLLLVRFFRADDRFRGVPIIVLSSKEEPKVKAEAFACGANDYIVKLPDKEEFIARIQYHSDAYIRLLQRNEAYSQLTMSQNRLQEELREAADYVRSALPEPQSGEVQVDWRFIPSTELGGDSFGYHWMDEDHFAIYLLDVCGHGVGAALLSISVMNVLRSEGLPNTNFFDPALVLQGLNKMFPMESHNQMFFTIWYGVYSKKNRTLTYSSGGHPPAILLTGVEKKSPQAQQLKTPGLIIGGMEEGNYVSATCQIGKYATLFIFSDGVFEIAKDNQEMHTYNEFVTFLQKEESLDRIVDHAMELNGSSSFQDDFSILKITLNE